MVEEKNLIDVSLIKIINMSVKIIESNYYEESVLLKYLHTLSLQSECDK